MHDDDRTVVYRPVCVCTQNAILIELTRGKFIDYMTIVLIIVPIMDESVAILLMDSSTLISVVESSSVVARTDEQKAFS